jgi:hypothetical protein
VRPIALCWRCGNPVGRHGVLPGFPSSRTVCPASPSLPWVPWASVPHLPRDEDPRRLPRAHLGGVRCSLSSPAPLHHSSFFVSLLCRAGAGERLELPRHARSLSPPRSALLLPDAPQGDHRLSHVPRLPPCPPALVSDPGGVLPTRPIAFRTAACRAPARRRLAPPGIPRGSPQDHDSPYCGAQYRACRRAPSGFGLPLPG